MPPTLSSTFARAVIGLAALALAPAFSQECPAVPTNANFSRQTLIPGTVLNQPVEMEIAKDGRVFVAERGGVLRVYNPETQQTTVAATLSVYLNTATQLDVGGLLGVAVSPTFAADNWIYLYYAPSSGWTGGPASYTGENRVSYRLSRFQYNQAANTVDLGSEQIFFTIPSVWATHNAGHLIFGKDGNLFLTTGDNSAHNCSDQFSPMDERPGFEYCDDQRSTANTNSLQGKVLRIHPEPTLVNGRYYTIPAGNLFPEGMDSTRPEVYAMGFRNPYRIFPDPVSNRLYIAEFGPSQGSSSPRGPAGADQIKITDSAGFFGYPYFLKNNRPYCRWNYATNQCIAIPGQSSLQFDSLTPRNNSPNNTGKRILPPAKPAVLWEHDGSSADPISGLKGCGFGAGPVYHYDPLLNSSVKFPPYFENKWIVFWIQTDNQNPRMITMPEGPVGPINQSSRIVQMPWTWGASGIPTFSSTLQDMAFGPDGALYALDYGTSAYTNNANDGLYRVTFNGCLPTSLASLNGRKLFPTPPAWVMSGQAISVPAQAKRIAAYDFSGRQVWQQAVEPSTQRETRLPTSLGSGPFLVRFDQNSMEKTKQ